jgi:RNA polymerase sigma factor (sigma-70 family)
MKFEEFIKELNSKIYAIALNISKIDRNIEVTDIVQEMHLHLWAKWKNNDTKGYTNSYLLQSCWFYIKNFLRKYETNSKYISLDDPFNDDEYNFMIDFISEDADSVSELSEYNFMVDKIKTCGLTEREKDVFDLLLMGYTLREIGSILKISNVRVSKIQSNLRKKAKRNLFVA